MDWFKILPLNVFLLAIGVYIISFILKKVLKDSINTKKTLKRLVPLIPLVLSLGGAFIPGVFPGMTVGAKLLQGCFSCFTAVFLHNVIKKTAFGHVNLPGLFENGNSKPPEETPAETPDSPEDVSENS